MQRDTKRRDQGHPEYRMPGFAEEQVPAVPVIHTACRHRLRMAGLRREQFLTICHSFIDLSGSLKRGMLYGQIQV